MSPPADGSFLDKHALNVPVQMVLQVLLFLGLGAELQVNVAGELREIAKTFLATAHAIPREALRKQMRVCCYQLSCTIYMLEVFILAAEPQ